MPLIAPTGPYSMRMQAWDQDGAGVMCIDIWFRVVSAPSAAAARSGGGGGWRLPGAAQQWLWGGFNGQQQRNRIGEWLGLQQL